MKIRLKRWFRHLLIASIVTVGASAASARVHDLPIFDSMGLLSCFGADSYNFQVDPNISSFGQQLSEVARSSFDWTGNIPNWGLAENPSLDSIQTEPRPEFSYLGPATTRLIKPETVEAEDTTAANNSTQPLPLAVVPFEDVFSPVKDDVAYGKIDQEPDDRQMCGEESFDCRPARPLPLDNPKADLKSAQRDESLDEAHTLVVDEVVADDSPQPNSGTNNLEAVFQFGRDWLPRFSLSESFSSIKSYVLPDSKPTVLALPIEPVADRSTALVDQAEELLADPQPALNTSESNIPSAPNYLRARKLVDDYLDGESFVRDWRSLQPLHKPAPVEAHNLAIEYGWVDSDPIANAVPLATPSVLFMDLAAEAIGAIETLQCYWTQEIFCFSKTRAASQAVSQRLLQLPSSTAKSIASIANHYSNSLAVIPSESASSIENFNQPLFAIHQLDGKEFLLPGKLARHWNCVPEVPGHAIDWISLIAASTKSIEIHGGSSRAGVLSRNYVEIPTAQSPDRLEEFSRNLIHNAKLGLDGLLNRVSGLASQLKLTFESNTQLAERADIDDVR